MDHGEFHSLELSKMALYYLYYFLKTQLQGLFEHLVHRYFFREIFYSLNLNDNKCHNMYDGNYKDFAIVLNSSGKIIFATENNSNNHYFTGPSYTINQWNSFFD